MHSSHIYSFPKGSNTIPLSSIVTFTRIAYNLENHEVFSTFSSLLVGQGEEESLVESIAVMLAVDALQEVSKKGAHTAEQKEGSPILQNKEI